MNLKVANLIAVQFGALLGVVSWLAYSRFESAEPRTAAAEVRESPAPAAVAHISGLGSQLTRALDDDGIDRRQDQSIGEQLAAATTPHQYSPEAVQQYYQQIAPRRYASSGLANSSAAAVAPTYTEVAQEQAAVSSDYAEPLQSVAYSEPAQVVVYQPQFIVFSNQRRFPNRCRQAFSRPGGLMPIAQQHPNRRDPRRSCSTELGSPALSPAASRRPAKSFGVMHGRHDSAPPCRSAQGFGPQGKR